MLNRFNLPSALLERCRLAPGCEIEGGLLQGGQNDGVQNEGAGSSLTGEFVLYWMRTAVRSEENPALDVARLIANQLSVPLVVYHASQHAGRLDPEKYLQKVSEPRFATVPHVAVIGAGISGLIAARTLQDHGLKVTVFEKSRGVGGRMSTRRVEDQFSFDHGAQYFTARDPTFRRYVDAWRESGLVESWPDLEHGKDQKIVVLEGGVIKSTSESQERFIASPAMNAIGKHLAADLDVHLQSRVAKATAREHKIDLIDEQAQALGQFDRVIVAIPAEQAADVLSEFDSIAKPLRQVQMKPCWALMAAFEKPISDAWVGAFLHRSFLSWASRNNTKPGRHQSFEQIVVHALPEWTAENWETDPEIVARLMLDEFWRVSGCSPQSELHLKAHRWKYAIPHEAMDVRCYVDESETIFACGDWAVGSRVEGAFLSGMAVAGRILGALSAAPAKNHS